MFYFVILPDTVHIKGFKQLQKIEFIPLSKVLYYNDVVDNLEKEALKLLKGVSSTLNYDVFDYSLLTSFDCEQYSKNINKIPMVNLLEEQLTNFQKIFCLKTQKIKIPNEYMFLSSFYIKIPPSLSSNTDKLKELFNNELVELKRLSRESSFYILYFIKAEKERIVNFLQKNKIEHFTELEQSVIADNKLQFKKLVSFYIYIKFYKAFLQHSLIFKHSAQCQYGIIKAKKKKHLNVLKKKTKTTTDEQLIVVKIFD